jgi:hypothetical protein
MPAPPVSWQLQPRTHVHQACDRVVHPRAVVGDTCARTHHMGMGMLLPGTVAPAASPNRARALDVLAIVNCTPASRRAAILPTPTHIG